MKRLIFLLFAIALFSAHAFAQSTARTALSRTIRPSVSYFEYNCTAADTIGTGQDSLFFEITTNRLCPINVAGRIEVTRTGSTDDYEYKLQGKIFDNDSWPAATGTPISVDSTNSATASASLYQVDVEVDATQAASVTPFYRVWRLVVASDGTVAAADKLTVDKVIFKSDGTVAAADKLTVDKVIFKIWDR